MLNLTDRKIMVTGASSGIGRATAILITKLGGIVVACGRNEERLDETLAECVGDNNIKLAFDVRDTNSYADIFKQAISDGKKLDGLVYSAGIAPPTPLRVLSESTIREVIDVNLIAFMMMTAMYAKRPYNNGGSIVAVSSVNSHYPAKCMTAYIASKTALEGAVRTFAIELAEKNIRINSIVPGPVDTPMGQNTSQEAKDYTNSKTLLGVSQPEDIANTIVFLLSDMARQITGRSLFVDGGYLGQ